MRLPLFVPHIFHHLSQKTIFDDTFKYEILKILNIYVVYTLESIRE